MARPKTETDEITSERPLQDELRALIQQQGELGQRFIVLAMRAEAEIADLTAEIKVCAAELGEARAELAELRAALEMERTKREIAEGRVAKLKSKVARIRSEFDDDIDEEDEGAPVVDALADKSAESMAPATDLLVETLGLTKADLAAVDVLVRRGDAPDRPEMLRTLVRRGLAAEGLPAGTEVPIYPDRGEEPQTAWC